VNLQKDRFTLVEALDRLIGKGVSVSGDVVISVADVDLVYLGLRALLCSAERVPELRGVAGALNGADEPRALNFGAKSGGFDVPPTNPAKQAELHADEHLPAQAPAKPGVQKVAEPDAAEHPARLLDIDPEQVERDLCRLVLTIVELLRELMERQAVRRMEGGSLEDVQVERLGTAFARLDEKMEELKELFGLADDDLNIDLGPLGSLR
jgi:Gas vesicle protein K/Gas vesicle protein